LGGRSKLSVSTLLASGGSSGAQQSINLLDDALKFIFSWIALMPIAIIVSGRYLGQLFRLPGRRRQFFQVSIPHVISIRAQDDEVIFGFSLFFIFLVGIAFTDGKNASSMLKSHFGPSLGQFNSLCVLSALATLMAAIFLYVVTRGVGRLRRRTDTAAQERDRLISDLSQRPRRGG
jgi:hypothetical protein